MSRKENNFIISKHDELDAALNESSNEEEEKSIENQINDQIRNFTPMQVNLEGSSISSLENLEDQHGLDQEKTTTEPTPKPVNFKQKPLENNDSGLQSFSIKIPKLPSGKALMKKTTILDRFKQSQENIEN